MIGKKKLLWIGKTGDANSWYHIYPFGANSRVSELEIIRCSAPMRPVPNATLNIFGKGATLKELWRMGVMSIRSCLKHRPQMIITFNPLPWGALAWLVAKVFRVPIMMGLIGGELDPNRTGKLGRMVVRILCYNSDVVTVTGNTFINQLVEKGICRSKLRVFPHCIENAWLDLPLNPNPRYGLITMAALLPIKRLDSLIQVIRKVHDSGYQVSLCILGDGPEMINLLELSRNLGLEDYIHFEGYKSDILPYLQASRIFVQTSRNEGLSIAMIEAMAVGVIPIVTKAGAESDHVCDGENGFLIDLDDFDLMAQRIVELQEKDVYNRMHQNLLVYRKQLGMEKATVFCEELILTYAR